MYAKFIKPRVLLSRCIEHEPVRYDGAMIKSEVVSLLKNQADFITVCPEVDIGLPTPRESLRIVIQDGIKKLIQPATGSDLTQRMQIWSQKTLNSLPPIDGAIMKAKSPSSGLFDTKYYPKIEKSQILGKGSGIFGEAVLTKYGDLAIEDDKRLLHPRIRNHFLTKLFTLASFRVLKESNSIEDLVEFQSRNKLLLTAYSQKELHILGRIVADRKKNDTNESFQQYQNHLRAALKHPPRPGANINIATKSFGYFSNKLEKKEREIFINMLDQYKKGQIPFSVPLGVLKAWITRFNVEYLINQTFFTPYPDELVDIGITTIGYEDKDLWKGGEEPE